MRPAAAGGGIALEVVHKARPENVFLQSFTVTSGVFHAEARLPRTHPHFGDGHPPYFDLMLVVEALRQGSTMYAHEVLGVPLGTHFMLREIAAEVADMSANRIGRGPGRLTMTIDPDAVSVERRPDGQPRTLSGSTETALDGARNATFAGTTTFVPANVFAAMRREKRRAAARAPRGPQPQPASADSVGRRESRNVVIAEPRRAGPSCAEVELVVDLGHPVFFDHELDHIPGPLLAEGARQLAIAAAQEIEGLEPGLAVLDRYQARFPAYAELHEPVSCRADLRPVWDLEVPAVEASVLASQDGRHVAEVQLCLRYMS